MIKVLGISASLRNARFGVGSEKLIDEIKDLETRDDLNDYLRQQTRIRADDFITAGRADGEPFDVIYRNLLKAKGDRGLSNSEAALVAGLWGAKEQGADIAHCGLASYFPMRGDGENLDELRAIVFSADALLVSGPVYFGDRGSVAQDFFDFLREDKQCAEHIKDMPYSGIAVGAKRNGGQETTLIYQIVDATNLNMLAVGNDSETTSQYGGTAHAGDIGTLADDEYGINTSIGAGRRIASVSKLMADSGNMETKDGTNIAIWLVQDTNDHHGYQLIEKFRNQILETSENVNIEILDLTKDSISRCIACDICPIDKGLPEDYRCIIKSKDDLLFLRHKNLISVDAILLAAYSPTDRSQISSVYQKFIERTRYLRRDDYVMGDVLFAPMVISEIGSNQNLHIRMLTSFIRHHTVLHHPIIGMEHQNKFLNWESMIEQGKSFVRNATSLTVGRLKGDLNGAASRRYNPVGYVISKEMHDHNIAEGTTESIEQRRHADKIEKSKTRVG
jgi:multimeric flavodoxin WrbA